jgi:hypothetical protein
MEARISNHVWSIEEMVKLLGARLILDGLKQTAQRYNDRMKWFERKGPRNLLVVASVAGVLLGHSLWWVLRYFEGRPPDWPTVAARVIGSLIGVGLAFLVIDLWGKRKANRSDSI